MSGSDRFISGYTGSSGQNDRRQAHSQADKPFQSITPMYDNAPLCKEIWPVSTRLCSLDSVSHPGKTSSLKVRQTLLEHSHCGRITEEELGRKSFRSDLIGAGFNP